MNNLALFASIVFLCASTVNAQDKPAAAPAAAPAPKHFYRLNYVLKESDEGKVINQRSYAISTTAGDEWTRMRAGTRIPVATGNVMKGAEVTYIDVGVNIDNRLRESGGMLSLELTADITSAASDAGPAGSAPTLRQVRATTQNLIAPGKPAVVFTADDPASRHRFELEATVTPER